MKKCLLCSCNNAIVWYRYSDGYICKKCYLKQYCEKNREKIRKSKKLFYIKNKDKISKKQKDTYHLRREKTISRANQWTKDNPEKYLARLKKWRENNKDKIKEDYRIRHYIKNKKYKQTKKDYYNKNKVQLCEDQKNRYLLNKKNHLVRCATNKKYGKAKECIICHSKNKVAHHHTEPYHVDCFVDLCRTCHGLITAINNDYSLLLFLEKNKFKNIEIIKNFVENKD